MTLERTTIKQVNEEKSALESLNQSQPNPIEREPRAMKRYFNRRRGQRVSIRTAKLKTQTKSRDKPIRSTYAFISRVPIRMAAMVTQQHSEFFLIFLFRDLLQFRVSQLERRDNTFTLINFGICIRLIKRGVASQECRTGVIKKGNFGERGRFGF